MRIGERPRRREHDGGQMAFLRDVNRFGNVRKAVREDWAAAMNIR